MFKPSKLSTAIATSIALLSSVAFAQESDTEQDYEEVIVTGIRASLSKAIDIKRNEVQVIESIVAEDIGKFPDNNVVEALQRVPGIQVTDRASGEVNGISIRGLTDVTTTINGRQMYISNGRFYTMADTPASLISRVDVYKTRSADKVPSGIAGQVDVHTQRPFNFDGSKVVINARGIYQDQEGKFDPNIGALISNRWNFNFGEIGALINVATATTSFRDQSITSGAAFPYFTSDPSGPGAQPFARIGSGWEPGLEAGLPFAAGSTLMVNGVEEEYILSRDAMFASDFSGKRERPAANIAIQFAPNETSEYTFEAFYNGYRQQDFNSLFFSFVDSTYNLDFNDDILLYEGTNIVKERTVYGAPDTYPNFHSGDASIRQTDSYLYAIGGEWDIGDNFHLSAEAYTQKSVFKSEFFAIRLNRGYYAMDVDFNSGDGVPALTYIDNPNTADVNEADLTDASQFAWGPAWDNGARDEGGADTLKIDANWDLDFAGITKVDFGLLYEVRTANSAGRGSNVSTPVQDIAVDEIPEGFLTTTSDFFDGRADFPSEWGIADGNYMFANRDYFRNLYGIYSEENDNYLGGGNYLTLQKTFDAEETTADAYIQASFEYEVGVGVIDGTVGVRYTDGTTDINFVRLVNSATAGPEDNFEEGDAPYSTVEATQNSSAKLLPSFVVRYNFLDDYMARFAYTETIRRPDFGALNPFITYNKDVTNIGYGTAGGGNPNLEPVVSTNLDFSLEYYFSEGNAIYGTIFSRDIEGLIVGSQSEIYYDYPDDNLDSYRHILSLPDNSANGELTGIELGLVYFPENLPGALDGLGIQASYTALDSSQDNPVYNDDGSLAGYQESEMFGVSNSSLSTVLAYEKDNFGARLSYVWRDAFRQRNEATLFANPLPIYRRAETSVDFQLSYDITDDFVITFDATNLTDEKYQEYYEHQDIYNFYSGIYSRTYALGIRYSY
ncbi:TonB-dependent receptor [Saccharophagus degradans]|uniref:TonB-dependent receptor n=1 Tax=Saccharophagus degradans TaxID=86304 RepID=UPI002477D67B|nr:TonB-dependent receptor [Saccharophagus degradans]WGO99241.1 TonB-dependent receptor [Saccharophagus degradans]